MNIHRSANELDVNDFSMMKFSKRAGRCPSFTRQTAAACVRVQPPRQLQSPPPNPPSPVADCAYCAAQPPPFPALRLLLSIINVLLYAVHPDSRPSCPPSPRNSNSATACSALTKRSPLLSPSSASTRPPDLPLYESLLHAWRSCPKLQISLTEDDIEPRRCCPPRALCLLLASPVTCDVRASDDCDRSSSASHEFVWPRPAAVVHAAA